MPTEIYKTGDIMFLTHKKLRIFSLILLSAFVFSGCVQQNYNSSDGISQNTDSSASDDISQNTYSTASDGVSSEPADSPSESFGWGNSMLILQYNEEGEPIVVTSYTLIEQSKNIRLELKPAIMPDQSLGLDEVDCELFFECEGNIIPHCVDGGEPVDISTHKLKANVQDNKLEITIPELVTKNGGLTLVKAVLNACPSFVPQNGFQEVPTVDAFPFFAIAEKGEVKDDVYIAQDVDYIAKSTEQRHDDIGYSPEHVKELGEYGIHMYHPVAIDDNVDGLYLTLNINKPQKYYTAVFCDGKLTDIFGGKHFISSQTDEKTLCYRIDKSLLPKAGMHTYEILPLCEPDLSDFDMSVFDTKPDMNSPDLLSDYALGREASGKYRVEIK